MKFPIGSTVRLRRMPTTHVGTICGGDQHMGVTRYMFHLDERLSDVEFTDRYIREEDLELCDAMTEEHVARVNGLMRNDDSMRDSNRLNNRSAA